MGLLLLSTTLLSLLVIGITLAADIPAGSNCPATGSGNTCISTTVCDKVHGKCLQSVLSPEPGFSLTSSTGSHAVDADVVVIPMPFADVLKAEQTCSAGTQHNCVSGASCVSNACTCGAAYTKENDKTCKPTGQGTVGFACKSTGDQCTTPNSECSNLDACKCKTDFVPNIENGKCDGIVGTTCTAADTCVASSVCDKVTEKCLLKAEQTCSAGTENNCVSGASCVSSACTCGVGYTTDNTAKICKPAADGTVGFACTSTGNECKTPNSECSSLGACKCKTGFVLNIENGKCDGIVGTACTAEDTCVASSICDIVIGKCLIKQGQSCVGNTDKCVSNAACVADVCKCDDTKAIPSTTGLCTPKNKATNSATLSFWLLLAALMSIFLADYVM